MTMAAGASPTVREAQFRLFIAWIEEIISYAWISGTPADALSIPRQRRYR